LANPVQLVPTSATRLEATSPDLAYEYHFDLVWRTLRRLGVDDAALDDAAQDVFLVVFRRWDDFAGSSALTTWIYGIVLRVASGYRRARRRSLVKVSETVTEALVEAGANPFEEASWREASQVLRQVLEGLEDRVRAAFVLVELEELTIQQASDVLGISHATCRSRLRTARTHVNGAFERLKAREQWRVG
jgi:RNA polymerase sigma-70 factor (ECF subfamily)